MTATPIVSLHTVAANPAGFTTATLRAVLARLNARPLTPALRTARAAIVRTLFARGA